MSAIVEQALGLSYGATKGEDDWNLWLDENLIKIGAVAQISVASMSENTPPGVFVEGRRVIVGPSPTGAYAGQAGKLTVGVEGDYKFYTILKGWDFYNEADGKRYTWSGSAFVDVVAAGITGKQANILFKEDGTSLGTTGTVTAIDFTGAGVTASRVGNALTVAIPGGGGSGIVESIVAGANVTVDNTDPANPIVSATGGGGGPATLTADTTVNVPTDYATLAAAIAYAKTLVPLNGARLTITVNATETVGQINVGAADLGFVTIRGLGLGPTINGTGWTPDPLYGAPFWLTVQPCAKLGPVVGAFRSASVAGAALLFNLGGETNFGQITEPLTIAGTFAAGIITTGGATHTAYGATHSSATSALNVSAGSRVVSSSGTYVGGVVVQGDFESSEDNITHGSGTNAVSVTGSGTARFGSSVLVGALHVADGGNVSGKVASITEPAAGFVSFIYASGGDVSLYAEGIEPKVGSAANLVSALSARVLLSGAASPVNTSTGFAAKVSFASTVNVGIAGTVASFTGGYSQAANTPTADGLILA